MRELGIGDITDDVGKEKLIAILGGNLKQKILKSF